MPGYAFAEWALFTVNKGAVLSPTKGPPQETQEMMGRQTQEMKQQKKSERMGGRQNVVDGSHTRRRERPPFFMKKNRHRQYIHTAPEQQ